MNQLFIIQIILSITNQQIRMQQETLITLKENSKDNLKQQIQDFIKEYEQQQEVCLGESKWKRFHVFEICELIQQWRVNKIWADNNQHETILREIEDINFPLLKFISIWGNNIGSIEGLCRINMPVIQRLGLYNNNIASMSPLRKGNFKSLRSLSIDNNTINDSSCLSELQSVTELFINYSQCGAWVLKMEAQKIEFLHLSQTRRADEGKSNYKWRVRAIFNSLREKCKSFYQY